MPVRASVNGFPWLNFALGENFNWEKGTEIGYGK